MVPLSLMNPSSDAHGSILKTVILFDLVDYPLTAWEIWNYLYGNEAAAISFEKCVAALNSSESLRGVLESREGFYFLKGRQGLVATRCHRYRSSLSKWKKARRFIQWLRWIPFIKVVAISNSLGYGNATDESDVDFFIIAGPGTLASTRLLSVGFAELAGRRPSATRKTDTLCLSFFVSEDYSLESLQLSDGDPLFAWWMMRIFPIMDTQHGLDNFFDKNAWIKKQFPHIAPPRLTPFFRIQPLPKTFLRIFRVLFSFPRRSLVEHAVAHISKVLGSRLLQEHARAGQTVVMNDHVLKLHINDGRQEYSKRFEQKWRELQSISSI